MIQDYAQTRWETRHRSIISKLRHKVAAEVEQTQTELCAQQLVGTSRTIACTSSQPPVHVKILTKCAAVKFAALNVEPLLRIDRSQLRWFGHVTRTFQETGGASPAGHTHGKAAQRSTKDQVEWLHPRSCLVLSWCGASRTQIAVDHEIFRVHLELLSPPPSYQEMLLWNWIKNEF